MYFTGNEFKGKGRDVKSARLDFKENIFQYVLSDKRLAELESSHPELVAEARKMKAHLEAKRAKSISGKV